MSEHLYDCAITGGGLAGLTLAIQLAGSGHSVILFEKEQYPFHKVCGEYISMESYDFLSRIGLPLSSMSLPLITEVTVSAPNGRTLTRPLSMGGFGISRYTMDAALAEIAKQKSVTLMTGTKVTDIVYNNDTFLVRTGDTVYSTRVACGAWGKRASLDQKLRGGLKREQRNYVGVKYHVVADIPSHRIELHNFKGGYCGISAVDGNKHCLCYLTDAKNLKENGSVQQMEQNVLMKNPLLSKYFKESRFLYDKPLTISQVTFSKKSAVENNVIMLGDAAGNIGPLCGNGMSMAMRASFLAYGLIDSYLRKHISRPQLSEAYQQQWDELFSGRIQAGSYLQRLFGKKHLTSLAISALRYTPRLTDSLIARTHGVSF